MKSTSMRKEAPWLNNGIVLPSNLGSKYTEAMPELSHQPPEGDSTPLEEEIYVMKL